MNDDATAITTESSSSANQDTNPAWRLHERLTETDRVNCNNRVVLLNGEDGPAKGKKARFGHSDPDNRRNFGDDTFDPIYNDANYGVYAGDVLAFIDIDDYEEGIERPEQLDTLPDTFTVESPHGGEHRYFAVEGDLENSKHDWGEIRTDNWYVIGPGSQLDGCDKDWCDNCATDEGGYYRILEDHAIASVEADKINAIIDTAAEQESDAEVHGLSTVKQSQSEIDIDVRLEHALSTDDTLRHLWRGQYSAEGFPDDRSGAEWALAGKLAFWFKKDRSLVRQLMNRACNEHPRTDYGDNRKWAVRTDETYREGTLDVVDKQDDTYTGSAGNRFVGSAPVPEYPSTPDADQLNITREDAHDKCTEAITDAFKAEENTLLEALPTVGKSRSGVIAAAETGIDITVLSLRIELYQQVEDWCAEEGLTCSVFPAVNRECDTYNGEHGRQWQEQVTKAYNMGIAAGTIHKRAPDLFGKPLPCDQSGRACPCGPDSSTAFDADADVLVGNFKHAGHSAATDERVVVFDEFPADAFDVSIESVDKIASRFLKTETDLPVASKFELQGESDELRMEAVNIAESKLEEGPVDVEHAVDAVGEGLASVHAPAVIYAMFHPSRVDVNDLYRTELPDGTVCLWDPKYGTAIIRRSPNLDDARAVVGLDGTPVLDLWEHALDVDLTHRRILTTEERRAYVTDCMEWVYIQTTENRYPYSGHGNANPERDGALLNAISDRHDQFPAVISTRRAIGVYKDNQILTDEHDYDHYGNLKSSNQFKDERIGAVLGSRHFGDDYVGREAAFLGETVEADHSGDELTYQSSLGDNILLYMREYETLQATMRFGRDGNGATVYVHTSTFPDWVPRTRNAVDIRTRSKGEKAVIDVLRNSEEPWTVQSLVDEVDIGRRQVSTILNGLSEAGNLVKESGRPNIYRDDGIDSIDSDASVMFADMNA